MDAQGRTKIVDFGIAHVNDASKVLTRVGVKMGSVRFMAPEQRTDASSVGAPADIYGLGITLISVLLGRTPKNTEEDLMALKGHIPEKHFPLILVSSPWTNAQIDPDSRIPTRYKSSQPLTRKPC